MKWLDRYGQTLIGCKRYEKEIKNETKALKNTRVCDREREREREKGAISQRDKSWLPLQMSMPPSSWSPKPSLMITPI